MFAQRYFSRYWADRYFPPIGAAAAVVGTPAPRTRHPVQVGIASTIDLATVDVPVRIRPWSLSGSTTAVFSAESAAIWTLALRGRASAILAAAAWLGMSRTVSAAAGFDLATIDAARIRMVAPQEVVAIEALTRLEEWAITARRRISEQEAEWLLLSR